jgi:hypothetical protein
MNLTRFDQDGLELFINEDGAVFASQRALARMCGKDERTIRRWKGAALIPLLSAEIQTEGGLQGAALFDEKAVGMALIRYNPELAQKCFQAGLRVFLYGLAGFQSNTRKKTIKTLPELSFGELSLLRAVLSAKQAGKPYEISQLFDPIYLTATLNDVTYAVWIKQLADIILTIEASEIGDKYLIKEARNSLPELEKQRKDLEHCINHDDFGFFKEQYEEFTEKLLALNALSEKSSRLLQ